MKSLSSMADFSLHTTKFASCGLKMVFFINCFQPFTKNYSKIHVLGHAASEPCSNVISYSIHIASLLVKFIHTPSNNHDISKKEELFPSRS